MGIGRLIGFLVILAALAMAAGAAELPSGNKKTKPPEALKHCNISGSPGVLAADGVCVRLSGYVSAGFSARQIK
jgi:hypothetical protein